MKSMRLIIAILAGDLLSAALIAGLLAWSERDSQSFDSRSALGIIALAMLFSLAGGYLAATIEKIHRLFAAFAAGALVACGFAISIIHAQASPDRTLVALAGLMAPAAVVGGILRTRTHPIGARV